MLRGGATRSPATDRWPPTPTWWSTLLNTARRPPTMSARPAGKVGGHWPIALAVDGDHRPSIVNVALPVIRR
jgi:hypothetical protein